MKREVPIAVKIIAVFVIISAAWMIVSGAISTGKLFSQDPIQLINETNPEKAQEFKMRMESSGLDYSSSMIRGAMVIGMIIIFCISAFVIFAGVSLWKGKNWARITLSTISFVLAAISLIGITLSGNLLGLIDLGVYVAIGTYLLSGHDVKEAFGKNTNKQLTKTVGQQKKRK